MTKKNLALQHIQKIKPYKPPLKGRISFKGLLLDFNERVPPVSKEIKQTIANTSNHSFQIYPEYSDINKAIAKYVGNEIKPTQVIITNGSDHAINVVFRTFTQYGDKVILPVPTFAILSQAPQKLGCKIVKVSYQGDLFNFPTKQILKKLSKRTKLVVICNPNNPTGSVASLDDIEKIAKAFHWGIVLVDEAYFEFCGITALSLLKKYPNIIILRTLSKAFGIPSLRFGYAIASELHIKEMEKVRDPYDINVFALNVAKTAMRSPRYARLYAKQVMNTSKPFVEKFFQDHNISFVPSKANFLLFKPKDSVKEIQRILQNQGILLRLQWQKELENFIRVSIGQYNDMKKFIAVYKKFILERPKKIAFLDRDGTLIYEPTKTYQVDRLKHLTILPGVKKGLKFLKSEGYRLVIVSNQDGLGTKTYPQRAFELVQSSLMKKFKKFNIEFDEVFICPHTKEDNCDCRKPKVGLVSTFLEKNNIDLKKSFVCGDRETDKILARNIKMRFIQMKTNGHFDDVINTLMSSSSRSKKTGKI